MSLIAFLNAVGPRIRGLDLGDLAFLNTLLEEDRYYAITEEFDTVGQQHEIEIPQGKVLVIVSASVVPAQPVNSTTHYYAELKFDGIVFDRMYYDYTHGGTTKIRESTAGHFLVGDGRRKVTVNVESIGGDVSGQVIIMGYYKNRTSPIKASNAPQYLTATELSSDDIKLSWIEPLNNGGSPITKYRIRRGDRLDSSGSVDNFVTLTDIPVTNENITEYDDTNLADNALYYYEVIPITVIDGVETPGSPSNTASARTEIDHPGTPIGFRVLSFSQSKILLTWIPPTDTGGSPIIGYQIQRSTSPTSGFADIVQTTGTSNLTYTDSELAVKTRYYYRIKAINTGDKSSLQYSDIISGFTDYNSPANLRSQVSSDARSVDLSWDVPNVEDETITGYKIERSIDGINFITLTDNTNSERTFYIDQSVEGGTNYFYRVSVVIGSLTGPPTLSHSVSIPGHSPAAPQNLRSKLLSDAFVKLDWDFPISNGGSPITQYRLQRSRSVGFPDGSGTSEVHEQMRNNVAKAISGNDTIEDSLTVSQANSFIIDTIEVSVNITHPWRGDMDIVLESPTGKVVTLKPADLDDRADNVIETYSGDIFNDYIGDNSEGIWKLKIRDIHELADDGTLNSWGIRFIKATEPITEILLENVLEYIDSGLDFNTRYFYRIRAENIFGVSAFSNITNITTASSIFGNGSDGDLVVSADTVTKITSNKNYQNITIEDGGILECSDVVVRCLRKYREIGTGKIVVPMTGCAGGISGTTMGGAGASFFQLLIPVGDTPPPVNQGSPATLTFPTPAETCTIPQHIDEATANLSATVLFNSLFANRIRGGSGSAGTAAAESGDGGSNRRQQSITRDGLTFYVFWAGGDGGTAAQGVNGVRGGGKFAFFAKTIESTVTIEAKGIDGIDGNQGTAQLGEFNAREPAPILAEPASSDGTFASRGSSGGIVFVVYDTIENTTRIHDTFETGLEGFVIAQPPANVTLENTDGLMVQTVAGRSENNIVISKTYDLPNRGTNQTILGFDWSYAGNTNQGAINRFFIVLRDADTDEELFRNRLGEPNVQFSGDRTSSFDITDALGSRTRVKLEIESGRYVRNSAWVRRRFDNFIFEYKDDDGSGEVLNVRISQEDIDVSGGIGGFHGADASADEPLTTQRAASGSDGTVILRRLADLDL